MELKMSYDRFKTIRRRMKGIIIFLWILMFFIPFGYCTMDLLRGSTYYLNSVAFYIWGFIHNHVVVDEYLVGTNGFLFALILFWIGYIINFGNIRWNDKKIIIRNIGYISGLMMSFALYLTYLSIPVIQVDFSIPHSYFSISNGLTFFIIIPIIIIIFIIVETYILNIVKLEKKQTTTESSQLIESNLKFCHNCGIKIKKESSYCEYCGINQN